MAGQRQGRKPRYKEHRVAVFDKRAHLLERVEPDADALPEYEGNDLPALLPVTAGVLHAPHKEELSKNPNCEVVLAPPELELRPDFPMQPQVHIHFSKRRRAVRLDLKRGIKPAQRPSNDENKMLGWIGGDVRPSLQARQQIREVRAKKAIAPLIREMAGTDKMSAFIAICRLGTRIEYAMPELFYIGDPCRAFLFVESLDLTKFAIAAGLHERKQAKRAQATGR